MMKVLPFRLDNPISTECWTYHYMGILMAHPQCRPFIMESFLSFYYDGTKVFLGSMDQPTTSPGFAGGVLCTESLHVRYTDWAAAVRESVMSDRYVLVFGEFAGREGRVIHELLVIGIDEENGTCLYVRNNVAEIRSIGMKELLEAHRRFIGGVRERDPDRFLLSYNYKGPFSALYPYAGPSSPVPRIELMKERLYRHIGGSKNVDFFADEAQARTTVCGLAVYDCLCETWRSRDLPSAFWLINNYRKILESRRVLEMSVGELSRYAKLEIGAALLERTGELCRQLETAVSLVMKYTVAGQEELIPRIIGKTEACRALDAAVCSELYYCLIRGLRAIRWVQNEEAPV